MWTKNHTCINTYIYEKILLMKKREKKSPAGRSVTLIELPAYDHDPDVKLGDVQILIL